MSAGGRVANRDLGLSQSGLMPHTAVASCGLSFLEATSIDLEAICGSSQDGLMGLKYA